MECGCACGIVTILNNALKFHQSCYIFVPEIAYRLCDVGDLRTWSRDINILRITGAVAMVIREERGV